MKELTDKQARVFDELHEQLAEYRKMHIRLKKLKSKYRSVCKETIIMDDECDHCGAYIKEPLTYSINISTGSFLKDENLR